MKRLLAALLAGAAFALPARAVETGMSTYPKGMYDFMAGALPPEGFYFSDMFYHFDGGVGAEVRNGVIESNASINLNADFLRGTYVTDIKFLGGTYAFGGALAVASGVLNANLVVPGGTANLHAGNSGFGDTILTPVLLGWSDGNFHWNASMSVYMPTGGYDKGQLNIGRNVWGFWPGFALTWFDPQSGWDVSGAFTYVTNGNNDDTDYQSGDLLHLDWALGKHFGAWEVGVAGNVMEQVGADRGSGAHLGALKAESFGLGPAISYGMKAGNTPVSLSAKWEHDVDSNRTFGGDLYTINATVAF